MPRTLTPIAESAIVAENYGYDVLIEAPTLLINLSWFHLPTPDWEQRLKRIDSFEVGVPSGGGVGFVSQLTFSIAEEDTGWSLLQINEDFLIDGATVTLKILFAGEDPFAIDPIFTGQISAWDVTDGEGHITVTDDRLARNILLPQTVVTRATHPNAPDESIGAAPAIVYSAGGTGAPIPLLLVDAVNSDYVVTGHANAQMLAVFGAFPFGSDRLKTIAAGTVQATIIDTNRLRLLQRLTETKFGANTAAPTIDSIVGTVQQAGNLTDDDPNSLATITTQAGDGIGRLRLSYAHPDPVGSNTVDIDLINHRKAVGSAVTVHGSFQLDTIRQDATVAIEGLFASLERRIQSTQQTEHFRVSGISLEDGHTLRMTVSAINETGSAGTANDAYEVGQIVVTASYLVSGPFEPIYLPDEITSGGGGFEEGGFPEGGFEEGSTQSFQGRTDDFAGTVTGTPFQVLENPVDVIASILWEELQLLVDSQTVDAARTARASWKMAGGLGHGWYRPRTSALDMLHSLCLQAGLYLFPQGNGTYVLKTVQPLESPTFTIGPAGSPNDYLLYENADPGSPPSNWRRTIRFGGGRNDQVRNNFEIRYAFHPARQQFAEIAQASWLGTNDPGGYLTLDTLAMLQLSHERMGPREAFTLDADFIYDEATAYTLLNLLIPYWMLPRQEVEFESTIAPLKVMPGDTVLVDTTGVPDRMRTQVFEVDRIRYDFEQGRIFLHGTQRTLLRMDVFRIRDQAGTIWYWWITGASQQLVTSLTPPTSGHALINDITPATIPYYLILQDETATTRYALPTPLGTVQVQSTVPAVGTGHVGTPIWRALNGLLYHVRARSNLTLIIEGTA